MNTPRWMSWRRRPIAAAARTIADWDATVRLPVRAHLLWLALQIIEARTTATETRVDGPLVVRDGRLSYPDPDPEDWDDTGHEDPLHQGQWVGFSAGERRRRT